MTAQQAATEASINRNFVAFFRAHRKEISSCEANENLLRQMAEKLILDLTQPESLEICYLSLRNQLAAAEQPKPKAVRPQPEPPRQKDIREMDKSELREYLKEQRTELAPPAPPKVLPASLEIWNPQFRRAETIELTAENLKKLDGKIFRELTDKYGLAAIQARLDSKS